MRNYWDDSEKARSKTRLDYFKQWYINNRSRVIKKSKEYYEIHKDNIIIRVSGYGIRWRKEMLDTMGGKCIRCGYDDYRALQIDHINGNGHKERRLTGPVYWRRVLKSYLNNEKKYQLLCANCNFIKRYENDELGKAKGGEK
jgi:hypothetical protein